MQQLQRKGTQHRKLRSCRTPDANTILDSKIHNQDNYLKPHNTPISELAVPTPFLNEGIVIKKKFLPFHRFY